MSKSERNSRGRSREAALFPVPSGKSMLPDDYGTMLDTLKERIQSERLRVTLAANAAMVLLSGISARQSSNDNGSRVGARR